MSFYSKIYEILDGAFWIIPITLGRVDPNNDSTTITSQIEAFRNTLFSSKSYCRFPEKIGENKGVKFFSTSSHVKKWLFFVFHDVAISSFVQYQSQITKM